MTRVELASYAPLSAAEQKRVLQALEGVLKKEVKLVATEDPSLLGGLRVKVDSLMVDASLKKKLQRLEIMLKGTGQ